MGRDYVKLILHVLIEALSEDHIFHITSLVQGTRQI